MITFHVTIGEFHSEKARPSYAYPWDVASMTWQIPNELSLFMTTLISPRGVHLLNLEMAGIPAELLARKPTLWQIGCTCTFKACAP